MAKRTKDIDSLFDEIKIQMTEQIEANSKAKIDGLEKENANLKDINNKLLKAAKQADLAQENFTIMNLLVSKLKGNLMKVDDEEKAELVYDFLDCFFEKDFMESTYETPLWLGCVAQYYTNRETIIKILRLLDFTLPAGIENFRLPHEWTEEELDVFFDNMSNHVVCNCCYFKDNLRFWRPNALDDPIKVCKHNFSEVPWQYILRNPIIKKEKYLTRIGEMFCSKEYRSDHWLNFAKITEYQELSEQELKLIIDNIRYTFYNNKDDGLRRFLFSNVELIENDDFLQILYNFNKGSYDFAYTNTVLKMPYKFIEQHMKDTKNLEWLKRNKNHFTNEQLRELTIAALED